MKGVCVVRSLALWREMIDCVDTATFHGAPEAESQNQKAVLSGIGK